MFAAEGGVFAEIPAGVKFLHHLAIQHQVAWQAAIEIDLLFAVEDRNASGWILEPGEIHRRVRRAMAGDAGNEEGIAWVFVNRLAVDYQIFAREILLRLHFDPSALTLAGLPR